MERAFFSRPFFAGTAKGFPHTFPPRIRTHTPLYSVIMRLLAHAAALAGLAHSVQAYYLPGIEPRAYVKVCVKQTRVNSFTLHVNVAGSFPTCADATVL